MYIEVVVAFLRGSPMRPLAANLVLVLCMPTVIGRPRRLERGSTPLQWLPWTVFHVSMVMAVAASLLRLGMPLMVRSSLTIILDILEAPALCVQCH